MIKTNKPGYLKDERSGLVVNGNVEQLENYRKTRNAIKKARDLEAEVGEIRATLAKQNILLQQILEKLNGV